MTALTASRWTGDDLFQDNVGFIFAVSLVGRKSPAAPEIHQFIQNANKSGLHWFGCAISTLQRRCDFNLSIQASQNDKQEQKTWQKKKANPYNSLHLWWVESSVNKKKKEKKKKTWSKDSSVSFSSPDAFFLCLFRFSLIAHVWLCLT